MVRSRHYRQGLTNDFLTFYKPFLVVLGHRFPDTDTHWSKIGKRVGNLHEILDYCQSWEAPEYIRTKTVSGPIRLHLQVRKLQKPKKMLNATQIKRIALHRISLDFSTFKCLRRRSQCTWEHWTYVWHALQHGVKYAETLKTLKRLFSLAADPAWLTFIVFKSRLRSKSEQLLLSSSPMLFLYSSSRARDKSLFFTSHLSKKSPSVSDPWACWWWRLPRLTASDPSSSSLYSPSLKSPSTEASGSWGSKCFD